MVSIYHKYYETYMSDADWTKSIQLNNIELQNKDLFIRSLDKLDKGTTLTLLSKYKTLLDSFVYGNSFVGNELWLLKYYAHQMIIWNSIATKQSLDDREKIISSHEIETLFYSYLNLIYNIKEKLQFFCNFKKGKKPVNNKLITENAKLLIEDVLRIEYPNIEILCKARKCLVHNSFQINYITQKQRIFFSAMDFNLSEETIDNKNEFSSNFLINTDGFRPVINSIYRMIHGVILILSNLENIDANILLSKFKTTTVDNKKSIAISF